MFEIFHVQTRNNTYAQTEGLQTLIYANSFIFTNKKCSSCKILHSIVQRLQTQTPCLFANLLYGLTWASYFFS
jgi:hypothetical protein